jgi:signal peptidase
MNEAKGQQMLRPIFDSEETGSVWIEGKSAFEDSHALITISNLQGEKSVVVTSTEIRPAVTSDFVEAPRARALPKSKKPKKLLSNGLLYSGYVASALLITFIALSLTGVVQARVVLTGSMAPQIKAGDVVLIKPQNGKEPTIGDVVTYTARRFDGTPVGSFTHRVVGGNSIKGYVLKGDANLNPDLQKVRVSDIVGTSIFVIPFIGKILIPKNLVTFIPLIFVLWLMVDRWRNE